MNIDSYRYHRTSKHSLYNFYSISIIVFFFISRTFYQFCILFCAIFFCFFTFRIDISMAIIKEIIRNCPNELVLNHLSNFMKHTSLKSYIVGSLCNMTMANLGKNSKQIIYFDSCNYTCVHYRKSVYCYIFFFFLASCTFQIFNILYRDCILNGDKNSLYVDTNLNMLKFFANILNADIEWLKYNDNR